MKEKYSLMGVRLAKHAQRARDLGKKIKSPEKLPSTTSPSIPKRFKNELRSISN